ncbi:MAG: TlpA family protein disulfide reductase [Planctomycetes bacterium]|nr:TlpA family protein disulfide reductase [Planctomycetota bacterium]
MKRTLAFVLAAAVAAIAEDSPKKNPPGGNAKEKLFSGSVNAGSASPAGAEIAIGWSWTLDADNFSAKEPIVADAKGRFEKSMPWKDKKTFLAVDKAHRLGAGMEIKEGDLAKPVTFRLQPMVRVKVRVTCKEAGLSTAGIAVGVKLDGAERIGTGTTKEGGLTLLLPPGGYKLEFRQEGWQPREARFVVPPNKPEFAAPDVDLTPSLLAMKMGQEMPEWHIADAIGLPKDAKLASLRGKRLLILFWRDGCPSCRGWGIPNLVKFHDAHAAWMDRLQIVAFHNKDASSSKDLQDFLGKQDDMKWNVLSLPFPVVIDAPGPSTVDEWGPGVFPYIVLLDAEGKLEAKGTLEEIEKRLEQELK